MVKIGTAEVTSIAEMSILEPAASFAGFDEFVLTRNRAWLVPSHYDPKAEAFTTSIQSWLIRMPGLTVLVDAGAGNGKERPASPRFHRRDGPFLATLGSAGVRPEDVDIVFLTHLHVDHVGWNTTEVDGGWQPTFPRARYVMSAAELAARDPQRGAAGRPAAAHLPFLDSVRPVIDAGQAQIVDGAGELAACLDFFPTPGHAPGQMALRLRSGGDEAIFIADVMHQPIQIVRPEINSKYCEDQEQARETRERVLSDAAQMGSLLLPAHFGGPLGGWVRRDAAEGYRFEPLLLAH